MTTTTAVRTPFTASSTAADVVTGVDLSGRRAVVTGGASGIGIETARALAGAGAEVTLAVRDVDAGHRAAADVTATTGNRRMRVVPLDLADQASVAAFATTWDGPLDVLVNNAGVRETPELRTPEGWELQFATNHLGHFALTTSLHYALAASGDARVVSVSSAAHLRSPVVFDDVHFRFRPYDRSVAYAQSKTANALFAVAASDRWARDGITVNALHPGEIRTKTPQQGAATSVLVAASSLLAGVGGRYFEDCNEAEPHQQGTDHGVADHARDEDAAELLWQVTLDALRG